MSDVAREIDVLRGAAERLDQLSKEQSNIFELLEPHESRYEHELAVFERNLWIAHLEEGAKLPSERLRIALFRSALPDIFLSQYEYLTSTSRRLEKEIAHLKAQIDARRSILSALKLELEATSV